MVVAKLLCLQHGLLMNIVSEWANSILSGLLRVLQTLEIKVSLFSGYIPRLMVK